MGYKIGRDRFEDVYRNKGIAGTVKELGCSQEVTYALLDYFKIERNDYKKRRLEKLAQTLSKDVLYDLYVNKKIGISKICADYDTPRYSVESLLDYYGIAKLTAKE